MEKSGLIRRINDIYVRLGDDISKKLFLNRMLYLITGDSAYMIKEIRKLPEGRYFYDLMETIQDRYLFGCGDLGKRMAKVWGGWKGFVDNNDCRQGDIIEDLRVYRADEIGNGSHVFISTRLYYKEVEKQLLSMGIEKKELLM